MDHKMFLYAAMGYISKHGKELVAEIFESKERVIDLWVFDASVAYVTFGVRGYPDLKFSLQLEADKDNPTGLFIVTWGQKHTEGVCVTDRFTEERVLCSAGDNLEYIYSSFCRVVKLAKDTIHSRYPHLPEVDRSPISSVKRI